VLSCAHTDRQTDIHTDYNQSHSTSLSRISNGDRSCSYIPGQLVLFTHGMLSSSRPWQGLPPCRGTGSVQVRDLVSSPSPQSAEHGVHVLQADHWPSTDNRSNHPLYI